MAPSEAEPRRLALVRDARARRTRRSRCPRRPAGTRRPRTGLLMLRLGRAFAFRARRSPRRDRPRAPLPVGVRLGRAWCSCTARTGGAGSRRAWWSARLAELRDRRARPVPRRDTRRAEVYERMGFRAVEALTRWRGQGGGPEAHDLPPLVDVAEIAELDRAAFGVDRSAVLADLLAPARERCPGAIPAATATCWHARAAPRRCSVPLVARETGDGAARCSSRRWPRSPARSWSTCPTARRTSPACSPSAGSRPSGPSCGWRSTRTRVSAIPRWFAPSRRRSSASRGVDALARDPGGRARGLPRRRRHPGSPARAGRRAGSSTCAGSGR